MGAVDVPVTVAICTGRGVAALSSVLPRVISASRRLASVELLLSLDARCGEWARIEEWLASNCRPVDLSWSLIQANKPGIANVRNAALQHALGRGGILAFIDDDAAPHDDGWLRALTQGFELDPKIAMTGGPINVIGPEFGADAPWWRSSRTDYLMSFLPNTSGSGYCDPVGLRSVNSAYRLSAVGKLRFDPALGWNSDRRMSLAGEETLFNMRLGEKGYRAWFASEATVDHYIDSARWTPRWLVRRAYIEGRTEVALARLRGRPVLGHAFRGLGMAMLSGMKLCVRAIQARPELMFVQLCNAMSGIGSVHGVSTRDGG